MSGLQFIPPPPYAYTTSLQDASTSAPSAPGLHDTLRHPYSHAYSSAAQAPAQLQSRHPLEARLAAWTQTQLTLKMTLLRRQYGLAEPLRRGMELQTVWNGDSLRPVGILGPGAGVHEDVLLGRDWDCSWEDVYSGQDGIGWDLGVGGVSGEMERMRGIWAW